MLIEIIVKITTILLAIALFSSIVGFLFLIIRSTISMIRQKKTNFQFKYIISWLGLGAFTGLVVSQVISLSGGLNFEGMEWIISIMFFALMGALVSVLIAFFSIGVLGLEKQSNKDEKIEYSSIIWHFYPILGLIHIVLTGL